MQVVRRLEEGLWRDFVEKNRQGNIFHTPEMYQVFARSAGCQPTVWTVVNSTERPLVLLLPVQITLVGGLMERLTSRAVVYGSILCDPSPEGKDALRMVLQTYKREIGGSILFTELRNLSDPCDLQPVLKEYDFVYENHLNFLMDLTQPTEEIWRKVHPNAKRNIQKARRLQVTIEEIIDPNRIPATYNLLAKVYKHIRVPLVDISLFQSAFEILRPKGMLKILVAKAEGTDLGVLTLLLYKDIAYIWYTGVLREHASYRAGDLLFWHSLEWCSKNGFRVFDFGGAGKPDEEYGVRDFKAKFGGTLVSFGRNVCVHSPGRLKLSELGYRLFRSLL